MVGYQDGKKDFHKADKFSFMQEIFVNAILILLWDGI